jgi:gliding motility-associated lipoprotein GldD
MSIKKVIASLAISSIFTVSLYYSLSNDIHKEAILRLKMLRRAYRKIDTEKFKKDLPYSFQVSKQANLVTNSKGEHWLNITYPEYGACIYLTYKSIEKPSHLDEYIADSRKLFEAHRAKSTTIQEKVIKTKNGYQATTIKIIGDAPSTFQFYTTDSTKHFLRGALYFESTKKSRIRSIIEKGIEKDVIHMLNTLQWQ